MKFAFLLKFIVFFIIIIIIHQSYSRKKNPENNLPDKKFLKSKIPAELEGDWYSGDISAVSFHNPKEKVSSDGAGYFLKIYKDGGYKYNSLTNSSYYGITTSSFYSESGYLLVKGCSISLNPLRAGVKTFNLNNNNEVNYQSDLKAKTFKWQIENNGLMNNLYMEYPNGYISTFTGKKIYKQK